MSNIRMLQAPQLKNPYSGWDNFADSLYRTSKNHLNRLDTQKQRDIDNKYKQKVFNNNVKNQDRTYDLNVDKFIQNVKQNEQDNSYRTDYFKWKRDEALKDFDYKMGRDSVKDNQFDRTYAFKVSEAAKPKTMTPYQEENIRLRNEAANAKQQQAQLKAIETLSVLDNWDKLSLQDQQRMIDYFNKTGLTPKINNPLFGDAYPDIPLNEQEKLIKYKQLEEDMKSEGL